VASSTPSSRGTAAEITGVWSGALRTAVVAFPLAFALTASGHAWSRSTGGSTNSSSG